MRLLAFAAIAPGLRAVDLGGTGRLRRLAVRQLDLEPWTGTTGDEETALLVLSGTHDFAAGGKTWPQRGVRAAPTAGRPLALFLPRRTPFQVGGGRGEVLLAATQDDPPAPPSDPREALTRKPLLTLAGSGKAFDPRAGAWVPEEQFAESPEFVLPRHVRALDESGVRVERIFGSDYKARVLGLDECVLQAGQRWRLGSYDQDPELVAAIYVRAEDAVDVPGAGRLFGEGVVLCERAQGVEVIAAGGPAYLAIVYA